MRSRPRTENICIRKGSLTEERYLTRRGTWDIWEKRARFNSDAAAERFVRRHIDGKNWGLFPG